MLRHICCWWHSLLRHFMSQCPAYQFRVVSSDGNEISVSEVSGLNIELAVIEHREGGDPDASVRKLPGLRKFSNIVLKRGIVSGNNDFFEWLTATRNSPNERRDLTISLLDERLQPVAVWRVRRAFPCKYSGPDLRADANEVAIESLELAHEGLEVESS
ncbi:MAG: phage tail protein [Chthoniobacterales bacterium]